MSRALPAALRGWLLVVGSTCLLGACLFETRCPASVPLESDGRLPFAGDDLGVADGDAPRIEAVTTALGTRQRLSGRFGADDAYRPPDYPSPPGVEVSAVTVRTEVTGAFTHVLDYPDDGFCVGGAARAAVRVRIESDDDLVEADLEGEVATSGRLEVTATSASAQGQLGEYLAQVPLREDEQARLGLRLTYDAEGRLDVILVSAEIERHGVAWGSVSLFRAERPGITCAEGTEVPAVALCDFHWDCDDGEDEADCP